VIEKNLKAAQDRQNIYVDRNRLFKEFQVREQVYLCIKLKKCFLQIGSCVKMAPRFLGPFSIIERIGAVAYRTILALAVKIHDVVHVSLLKKYDEDVDHVID